MYLDSMLGVVVSRPQAGIQIVPQALQGLHSGQQLKLVLKKRKQILFY